MSGLTDSITEMEGKAKAMIKQQKPVKEIAYKTGLSLMWIELQYLGGRSRL